MAASQLFGYSIDTPTTSPFRCQAEGSQEGPGPLWAALAQRMWAGGCFTADSVLLCWCRDATPNQESSSIFARTCRSRLNVAMAEPTALSLCGQLWKSMFLEDWMQKKIPETTKDVVLIVCRLMFFVFTSRNVNCGALLAQLKEWFDYQQRKQRIDLKAGRRSRLKTRWYVWARQSSTWQNTSVLALLFLAKRSNFTEIDFQWRSFTSITLGHVVKGTKMLNLLMRVRHVRICQGLAPPVALEISRSWIIQMLKCPAYSRLWPAPCGHSGWKSHLLVVKSFGKVYRG